MNQKCWGYTSISLRVLRSERGISFNHFFSHSCWWFLLPWKRRRDGFVNSENPRIASIQNAVPTKIGLFGWVKWTCWVLSYYIILLRQQEPQWMFSATFRYGEEGSFRMRSTTNCSLNVQWFHCCAGGREVDWEQGISGFKQGRRDCEARSELDGADVTQIRRSKANPRCYPTAAATWSEYGKTHFLIKGPGNDSDLPDTTLLCSTQTTW